MFTGEDIKLLRFIKKLPQKTLAEKSGTRQQAVSKNENSDEVSDKTFEKYCRAVDWSIEEFKRFKGRLSPDK